MSTNKTENYHLHAWEAGDDFLRSEFNENFTAIDGLLGGLPEMKKLRIFTGSYIGTGFDPQPISLSVQPKVVFVTCKADTYYYYALWLEGTESTMGGITDTGFQVKRYLNYSPINKNTYANGEVMNPFNYIAFWWEE